MEDVDLRWVRNKPWGTEGSWVEGHPALKRFGAQMASDAVAVCHLALQSFFDEPITLLWLHEGQKRELAELPAHGTLAQLSYEGHRFQVRSKGRLSNLVSCRAPSSDGSQDM